MQNRKRQTFFVTVTNRKSRACYFASVTERRQNTFDKMGFSPHRADRSDKRPFLQKNAALNSSQIPLSALRRALRLSYFSPPVIIHHFFSDCNTIYSNSESFTIIVFETKESVVGQTKARDGLFGQTARFKAFSKAALFGV